MLVRDATNSDAVEIASLAQENDLLLDGLTPSIFVRMLEWLYLKPPTGKQIQLVAVDSNKKIIAHYGGVPFCFKWGKREILGLLASNLVVAKDFRKQSPFLALQRSFAKTYTPHYSFAYGAITRKGVLEPHLRMGWKLAGSLNVYVRPVAAAKILNKMTKDSPLSRLSNLPIKLVQKFFNLVTIPKKTDLTIHTIIQFDDSWDSFLKNWMSEQEISSVRSPEVLNWRYCQFLERNYQVLAAYEKSIPVGYAVLRKMPMKQFVAIAITEVVSLQSRPDVFNGLIRESILRAEKAEVDLIATALTDHDKLRSLFRRAGFIRTSEKFSIVTHCPKSFVGNPISTLFPHWHVNWFDHDYV